MGVGGHSYFCKKGPFNLKKGLENKKSIFCSKHTNAHLSQLDSNLPKKTVKLLECLNDFV